MIQKPKYFLTEITDIFGAKQNNIYEQQANKYAQKSSITENQWTDLVNSDIPLTDDRIKEFAFKYRINPAIVLGRVCHDMNYYAVKSSIDKTLN